VVRVDPALTPAHAAMFGCALQTGVGAVVNTAAVSPGTSVAVFGLGGVGMAAVMGAHLAGAHPVIAVDPVAEKRDKALQLGATHAVAPGPDAVAEVQAMTAGGADYTFEAAGRASVMADAYYATAAGGTTVAIGLPHPREELRIPAHTVVGEERRIVGSYMGSSVPHRDIPRLVELYRAGRLPVDRLISGTTDLAGVNASFDALHEAAVLRQIVVPGSTGL
jgi:alcohol dehydrogenase